ncbi:MAG TPA: tetratricopeptide repeat protein [Sphingomicrobium sp.]|nr:tetratricopeptide repeat protein [Sphingomicrobium sp.]
MRLSNPVTALAASAAIALAPASSALAQRQQPTPEQRIDRLERQVQEMERRVYPKGKPADTAGYSDDPAATQSSVMSLDQRLDALERQMTDMLRQTEENNNRLRTMETGLGQLRTDEDQRIQALEQRATEAAAAAGPSVAAETLPPAANLSAKPRPKPSAQISKSAEAVSIEAPGDEGVAAPVTDAGEDAYTQGFHLWEAGKYDEAISTLKAFVSAYPKHRRVSYANNLIGRSLLDKGDARSAATALLANYRSNPGGERAPDSLFYLGQALTKLGQAGQACKAYGELDAVYGAKIRPDLKKLETDAKTEANCG